MGISKSKKLFLCAGLLAAVFLVCGLAGTALADDAKAMLKEVKKELKQAERDMFGGKTDKAIAALPSLKEKLLGIRTAAPETPGLDSVEKKYQKLVKDLERRTGKDLGGGSLTSAGTGTQPKLPPKPQAEPMPEKSAPPAVRAADGPAKLPHHARGPIASASSDLSRIDGYVRKMSDPNWNKEQLIKNMNMVLESARKNFETGKAIAAEKGVTSHPDFEALEAELKAAEEKIATAKRDYEKSAATAAADAIEVQADVKKMMDAYDMNKDLFNRASGAAVYYNDLEPLHKLMAQIEDFEKNRLQNLQAQIEWFGGKYGTSREAIDQKADAMGYSDPYYRASYAYTEIVQGIENIGKTRTATAEDLVRRASDMKQNSAKGIHDFFRIKQQATLKDWGRMAARFDPENPGVKEFNAGIETWIAEDTKALNAKIDRATFPQQAADAPKNAKSLAETAREFLQKEEDALAAKGKQAGRVAAVAVTGPWRVFKRNIVGEPVQYNLPIATAVQIESEKSRNLMRVYHSTLLTREFKGVEMAPPFTGVTVGDSYYIRPSAIR